MTDEDQRYFDAGVDEFFAMLFEGIKEGDLSHEEAERFFPKNVKERCEKKYQFLLKC